MVAFIILALSETKKSQPVSASSTMKGDNSNTSPSDVSVWATAERDVREKAARLDNPSMEIRGIAERLSSKAPDEGVFSSFMIILWEELFQRDSLGILHWLGCTFKNERIIATMIFRIEIISRPNQYFSDNNQEIITLL